MKIEQPPMGVEIIGKIPSLGVTKYIRNGVVVTRVSTSDGHSNTPKQFIQRQRMRHSLALWKELSRWSPMFTEGKTAYHRFLSLANQQLPVVFLPKNKAVVEGSLLMPGIPMSEGSLLPIQLRLGEVDGTPALLTDRKADDVRPFEVFMLYTAEQHFRLEDCPMVVFKMREVKRDEFAIVDGCLALVDNDFANEMKGWALVRVIGRNCSTQSIVTRCTHYQQYTTEEAMEAAAKSYGGLK